MSTMKSGCDDGVCFEPLNPELVIVKVKEEHDFEEEPAIKNELSSADEEEASNTEGQNADLTMRRFDGEECVKEEEIFVPSEFGSCAGSADSALVDHNDEDGVCSKPLNLELVIVNVKEEHDFEEESAIKNELSSADGKEASNTDGQDAGLTKRRFDGEECAKEEELFVKSEFGSCAGSDDSALVDNNDEDITEATLSSSATPSLSAQSPADSGISSKYGSSLSPKRHLFGEAATIDRKSCAATPEEDRASPDSSREEFEPSATSTASKKKTRKRLSFPSTWQCNVNKSKIARGEEYINSKGKVVTARSIQPPCDDTCRLTCTSKISQQTRQEVFDTFWKELPSKEAKWLYLSNLVIQYHKVKNADKKTKRSHSRKYYLPVKGDRVQVCKVMFLATLDISDGQINTAHKKGKGSPDKRGSGPKRPRTVNADLKQSVRDHINSLPRMPSHYSRKKSEREYLIDDIESIKDMHQWYLKWLPDNAPNVTAASYRQYTDIFNQEFNISFFITKKDQCDLCLEYQNSSAEEKLKLQEVYDDHDKNKTVAQDLKLADSEVAKRPESKNLAVICFDFEKALICPKSKASLFYYKRKLSVNNFTLVRVGKINEGVCYVYDETVAHKGSNEVASFLFHYLSAKIAEGVTEFRLYCDNCWGQNKSRAVATFLAYLTSKFAEKNIIITLRFLEEGHSYNSADTVHSLIERKIRNADIFVPGQYYDRIASAKRSKSSPIQVIRVQQDMISDWKELADKLNFAKDSNGTPVPFTEIRELRVDSKSPFQINFKLRFEEAESKVIFLKKVGQPVNFQTYKLLPVYTSGPLPISKQKMDDLMYYCQHKLIPQEYHEFFKSLPSSNEDRPEEDNPSVPPPGRARKRRAAKTRSERGRQEQEESGDPYGSSSSLLIGKGRQEQENADLDDF